MDSFEFTYNHNELAQYDLTEPFDVWWNRIRPYEDRMNLDLEHEVSRVSGRDELAAAGNESYPGMEYDDFNDTSGALAMPQTAMNYNELNDTPGALAMSQTTMNYGQADQATLYAPTGQTVSSTPANNTQLMPGVGILMTLHGGQGNINAGYQSYYQHRRTLNIPNDDFQELNTHNAAYVRRVYTAITTTSSSMNEEQATAHHDLSSKLKKLGSVADQHMADISAMVVSAVYNLHSQGDFLYAPQFKALKPTKEDSTMTATERVGEICRLLFEHKKHVKDIMVGADAITHFVAAPLGASALKKRFKRNNDGRKAKMAG